MDAMLLDLRVILRGWRRAPTVVVLAVTVLYGVGPGDPLALLLGASTLVLAALIACWAPARRAARLEPMTALKEP